MSDKILKEKREALGRVWEEYKTHRDSLPTDDKSWTEEQRTKLDAMNTEVEKIEADINSVEARMKREKADEDREKRYAESTGGAPKGDPNQGGGYDEKREEELRNEAFEKTLRGGVNSLNKEERAMMAGNDVSGGFIVAPEKFVSGLLKEVDDQVVIRGLATTHQLKKAASLGVVKLDSDIDDWAWTTELATGTEDTGLGFGKRELRAHPLAKRVKMSKTLIRLSNRDVQALVRSRMSYKLGGTMESNYMTGPGVGGPLGMFVASSDGISTARDVATDNTATAITADNLIEVQGKLKSAYQKKAQWLFHRDSITKIRKLKGTDLQYLWQPGLQSGVPNMILGKPYKLSEWCPNTRTANLYVGMYADFSYYWIVDALDMQVQVLFELYAESNQIGYIGRYEGDGQPVLEEAFVRIKMGA